MTVNSSDSEPQQARARRTRRAIIDAALERFGTDGFRKTKIADVASDAGVTDAGLLYHFPTKEALLFAVMQAAEASHGRSLHASLLDSSAAFALMREWGAVMEQEESVTALNTVLSAEHLLDDSRVHDYFSDRYRTVVAAMTSAFEDAQAAGEIVPEVDPEVEARLMLAAMDGARLQYFYGDGEVSMADLIRNHVDRMLERIGV